MRIKLILSPFLLTFSLVIFRGNLTAQTKESNTEIEGSWISIEDNKYEIRITNDTIFETYFSEKSVDTFIYAISNKSCFQSDGTGTNKLFIRKVSTSGDEDYCYQFLRLGLNEFILAYEGNGSTFRFQRRDVIDKPRGDRYRSKVIKDSQKIPTTQHNFRIILPEYDNYTLIPMKCVDTIISELDNGDFLRIHLFDCKGKMNIEYYKDSALVEKGSYINSLDLLKSYYYALDASTLTKRIKVSSYYQPLRDGTWYNYSQTGKTVTTRTYDRGILVDISLAK